MKIRLKSLWKILADTAIRLVWSSIVALIIGLILALLVRWFGTLEKTAKMTLTELIYYEISLSFPQFLGLVFPLFLTFYLAEALNKIEPPHHWKSFKEKIRSVKFETRLSIAICLKRIGLGCIILFAIVSIMIFREMLFPIHPEEELSYSIFLAFALLYFFSFSSLGIAKFLMTPLDMTIHHMTDFEKDRSGETFLHALISYNRAIGYSLSPKKILEISQTVEEAYKIGAKQDLGRMNMVINGIIESLRAKAISNADKKLVALSRSAMNLTEGHRELLGFKIKYPRRLRITEGVKKSLSKVFVQVMLFLLWIGLLIILAVSGLLPLVLVPQPFG